MNAKFWIRSILVIVAIVGFCFHASATPIVTNGGFETGDFTGWTRSGNTTDDGVNTGSRHSGNYGAFFVPVGSLEYLSQNLSTVAGMTYDLSFFLLDDVSNPTGDIFQVYWNGLLIFQIPPGTAPNSTYDQFNFTALAATGASTELKFGFQSQLKGGWVMDDIVVNTAVSAPETLSTLWLALPLLGLFAARRSTASRAWPN